MTVISKQLSVLQCIINYNRKSFIVQALDVNGVNFFSVSQMVRPNKLECLYRHIFLASLLSGAPNGTPSIRVDTWPYT